MKGEEEEDDKDTGGGGGSVQEEEEHASAGDVQEEELEEEKDAGAGGGEATDFEGQQQLGVTGERLNGLQRLASAWDDAGAGEWVRGLRVGDKLEVYSYKSRPSTEYFCSTSTIQKYRY